MIRLTRSIRTKLLAAFGGLAAIALFVVAVDTYTVVNWQRLNGEIDLQYRRSLLLERVRSTAFQALQEVGEVDDLDKTDFTDARDDFERVLVPATRDFQEWSSLASTSAERAEVEDVRRDFETLVSSGRRVFEAAKTNQRDAIRIADDEVDTKDFDRFAKVTERVAKADSERRRVLAERTADLRRAAEAMLATAAISTVSLVLLIAAFLSSDVFQPLRRLTSVLQGLAAGDGRARAAEDRGDEFGTMAAAVNRVAERLGSLDQHAIWRGDEVADVLISPELRGAIHRLAVDRPQDASAIASMLQAAAIRRPTTMATEPVDPPTLVRQALARLDAQSSEVKVEMFYEPPGGPIYGDAARLGTTIDAMLDLVADSVAQGERLIGIRCRDRAAAYWIEVAGPGAMGMSEEQAWARLRPARLVAEGHGGELRLVHGDKAGLVLQLVLPYQAHSSSRTSGLPAKPEHQGRKLAPPTGNSASAL